MVVGFSVTGSGIVAGLPFGELHLETTHGEGFGNINPMRRFAFLAGGFQSHDENARRNYDQFRAIGAIPEHLAGFVGCWGPGIGGAGIGGQDCGGKSQGDNKGSSGRCCLQ